MPSRKWWRQRWVAFFIALTVLTAIWSVGSLLFKRAYWGTTVTRERLAQARALWQAHGAADYDLEVVRQGPAPSRTVVRVRGGRVVYAEPDERPLAQKARDYGMPALFDLIEHDLDRTSNGPPAVAVARFDPYDGHLIRFARRIPGSPETLQVIVKNFQPLSEPALAGGRP